MSRTDRRDLALSVIVYAVGPPPPVTLAAAVKSGPGFSMYAMSSPLAAIEVASIAAGAGCGVGVAAGDVLVENEDRYGTPVVLAARLASAAVPHQVLCDPLLGDLAPERRFAAHGPLHLKGFEDPVEMISLAE